MLICPRDGNLPGSEAGRQRQEFALEEWIGSAVAEDGGRASSRRFAWGEDRKCGEERA